MKTTATKSRTDHGEEEGHGASERWLLTYADMITLLLVLFVVLYALSSLNHVKYAEFVHGLNASVVKGTQAPSSAPTKVGNEKVPQSAAHSAAVAKQITAQLIKALRKAGLLAKVSVKTTPNGVIEGFLAGDSFYGKGVAELSPVGARIVDVSATVLVRYADPITVDGYADNEPIYTGAYANNWYLSSARADVVVSRLSLLDHVAPTLLTAVGLGQYHPLVPNTSAANQAQNRRVNIVIDTTNDTTTVVGSGSQTTSHSTSKSTSTHSTSTHSTTAHSTSTHSTSAHPSTGKKH